MRFRFNNFVLDCEQKVLWAQGQIVPLSPKVFDTLRLLVTAGGRIVTKQEFMDDLWPDSFVEDSNLTQNIFVLRKILGNSADGLPYIETVPRRGYRFVGAVQSDVADSPPEVADVLPLLAQPVSLPDPTQPIAPAINLSERTAPPPAHRNLVVFGVCSFIFLLIGVSLIVITRWKAQPSVGAFVRLTDDGASKGLQIMRSDLITDGHNLYFDEVKDNHNLLAQVPIDGGETTYTVLPSPSGHLIGLGMGGRALLYGHLWPIKSAQPLLSLDLSTGAFNPVFNIDAQDASWSTDGTRLAFARSGKLFVRSADGSTRLIASVQGMAYWPRWSPDGRNIRFSENYDGYHDRLWEVSGEGGDLHQLFADQSDSDHVCCGSWTSSGRSFIYLTVQQNSSIHVRPAYKSFWDLFGQPPIDVPAAPLDQWASVVPAVDGKHIFAIGGQLRGRLVRIDPVTRHPEPYLGGISAEGVSFSPDAADIVYTAYPEGTIWRSRIDGSGRVQLTQPPLVARFPRWSPDGSSIAFIAARPGSDWHLYTVPANGGEVMPLLQESTGQGVATWSPDGKSLAFGHILDMTKAETHPFGIDIFRLSDRKTTLIPGSAGMWTARWSPDGRFLSAVTIDNQTLRLYDMEKGTWTDLAHGSVNDVAWSGDSKSLFFDSNLGAGPVLYKVRISDRKLETYATLDNFRRAGFFAPWLGVAPDGSPILLEDSSIQEVYSIAVDLR